MQSLLQKYNVAGPRYTSYPTVPYWEAAAFSKTAWLQSMQRAFEESNESEGISLYIHLPFCENLCTFCGCHKHITKRHEEVEAPYIEAVLKEWELYLQLMGSPPSIREIHLGGGTPTFFSTRHLRMLIEGLLKKAVLRPQHELSFEGHPNHTSQEQLQCLYELGFRRCSFGVQDYDPIVQRTINRIQPYEYVKRVTEWAREIGYTSVSHDLVFGLPKQRMQSIVDTIHKTNTLLPDRISFYSYAHVPWIKGVGQRGFDENDLPKDAEKRALYEKGKEMFAQMGYVEVGMDHFALKTDSLYQAMVSGRLHRNFMGYTSGKTQLMIGLGMSAISDSWYCFAQNVKSVKDYQQQLQAGEIPVFRGHLLNEEDLVLRQHVLNLMCYFKTSWKEPARWVPFLQGVEDRLAEMQRDGLVKLEEQGVSITPQGIPFIRNACMAFDARLQRNKPQTQIFSKTV
ncbi:MAG: oxygen-independent coproporphyrinogen III oxidase [Bacteroidetes bacterium]|nr:MAG: oxygen-independent coproporphyrinogen III oxidase [Bacteroidota bacterium]